MKKEFVMRGQTASGGQEVLEFGARTKENKNIAYRLIEFAIYPSTGIGSNNDELAASITAGKTALDPTVPNFNDDGLIATALFKLYSSTAYAPNGMVVINDTFSITQNLKLLVKNTVGDPVNWQCRFRAVKMSDAEMAATNFKQYTISDGS